MNTLFVDTHDKKVVIVLLKDGIEFDKKCVESKNKHSEVTLPLISEILQDNNLKVNDLNEIVVVNGPGSFTGVRLAVTISKTMAYALNIPIKVIDSLSVIAVNIDANSKIVSIPDRNGAFVGKFNNKNIAVDNYTYMNKSEYSDLITNETVYEESEVEIDYNKVYLFVKDCDSLNPHEVKPLYVKGISALNDKKN